MNKNKAAYQPSVVFFHDQDGCRLDFLQPFGIKEKDLWLVLLQ